MFEKRDWPRGRRAQARAVCCSVEDEQTARDEQRTRTMLVLTGLGVAIAAVTLVFGAAQWYASARPHPGSGSDHSTLQVNVTVND